MLLWISFGGALSLLSLGVAAVAFGAAYVPTIPIAVRFFPYRPLQALRVRLLFY